MCNTRNSYKYIPSFNTFNIKTSLDDYKLFYKTDSNYFTQIFYPDLCSDLGLFLREKLYCENIDVNANIKEDLLIVKYPPEISKEKISYYCSTYCDLRQNISHSQFETFMKNEAKSKMKFSLKMANNPNLSIYEFLLEELTTTLDNEDNYYKKYHYLLLKSLIKRKPVEETLYRFKYLNLFKDENYATYDFINRQVVSSLFNIKSFIEQSSNPSLSCKTWAYYNLLRRLSDEVILTNERNNQRSDSQKIFYTFLPIIITSESDIGSISSGHYDHWGNDCQIAYVFIEEDITDDFWEHLPELLHEFYHYIPSNLREKRNDFLINLIDYLMFNGLFEKLESDSNCDSQEIYNTIHETWRNIFWVKNFPHLEDLDTMLLLNLVCASVDSTSSFERLYANLIESIDNSQFAALLEEKETFVSIKNFFEKNFKNVFAILSRFLRELRSDIAMCQVLNLTFENYFNLIYKCIPESCEYNTMRYFMTLLFLSRRENICLNEKLEELTANLAIESMCIKNTFKSINNDFILKFGDEKNNVLIEDVMQLINDWIKLDFEPQLNFNCGNNLLANLRDSYGEIIKKNQGAKNPNINDETFIYFSHLFD